MDSLRVIFRLSQEIRSNQSETSTQLYDYIYDGQAPNYIFKCKRIKSLMHLYKINDQLFEVKYISTMLNAVTCNTEESVKLVTGTLYNKRHWTTISHHLLCYFWCSAALLSSTTKTSKSCLNTRGQMEGHN